MFITEDQIRLYEQMGYLLVPGCFSQAEIAIMKAELPALFAEDSPRRVVEKEGATVRSIYGSHMVNDVFRRLSRHPQLVEPVTQILQSRVYVYQFKINAKEAFDGDVWEWHQDYVFWRKEDGMPMARVTNVAIFLDEVNEFNGPMYFIPRSHLEGVIDVPARDTVVPGSGGNNGAYENSPSWISNLTAKIKYSVGRDLVAGLVSRYGMIAPKGPSGSVLFFHPNLVHASPNNISPFSRIVVFVTYNSIENAPGLVEKPRPEFLVNRDCEPIEPLPNDILLQAGSPE